MTTQQFRLVFTGQPNTGKGTITTRVAEFLGRYVAMSLRGTCFPHFSAGGLLRQSEYKLVEMGVPADKAGNVHRLMAEGKMVDADVIHACIGWRLGQPDCQNHWAIDGFPRIEPDYDFLERLAKPPTHLIILTASDDRIRQRAADRFVAKDGTPFSVALHKIDPRNPRHPTTKEQLSQRNDDQPQVVEARLAEFNAKVRPTLELYKACSRPDLRIIEQDTTDLTPEVVLNKVLDALLKAA